jgi:small subunit ribosomal protein S17
MADEPDNENELAAAASEESAAPEEAAPEAAADAPEQAAAPAQGQGSAPADQAGSDAARLSSKERRRKARSTHAGEARPTRSPEERHAERAAERKTKAARRRTRRLQERAKRAAARSHDGGPSAEKEQLAPVHAQTEGVRKTRQGVVVSDKADKTITVRIDTARRHRRYEKIVRSSSTLHAHDENNDAHEGDTVRVIESRPLSRSKRWRLVDVLERAR